MTVSNLFALILVDFPDLSENMFLAILNQSMRIIAEDTNSFNELESITTDGNSVYDLSEELTEELYKIIRIQLDGITIEKVQAEMLENVDI